MLRKMHFVLLALVPATLWACTGSTETNGNATGGQVASDGEHAVEPAGIDSPPADSEPAEPTSDESNAVAALDENKQEDAGPSDEARQSAQVKELSTGYDAELEKDLPAKDSVEGRWLFLLTQGQQGQDLHLFLIEIAKGDGDGLTAKLAGITPQTVPPTTKLTKSEVGEKSVHLVFDVNGQELDFQGQLDGALIRGNIVPSSGGASMPSRMVPTELASLDAHNPMHPTIGRDDAIEIQEADDRIAATREFARKYPTSPLAPMVYGTLFGMAESEDLDEKTVDEMAEEYRKYARIWGERQAQFAEINIAAGLAMGGYSADVSNRYLDLAEQRVTDESLAGFKEILDAARDQLKLTQAREQLESDDATVREAAYKTLQQLHEQQPFNAEVTLTLADYAAENDMTDQAIALFAELTALPNMEQLARAAQSGSDDAEPPLPSERLATLWKDKHGNTEGLDEYLREAYAKGIDSFARERVSVERPENARTSLVELFTGATCPPCVAADVATGGLEVTYPSSTVIVLRYHMHIPGPDPLANPDTEARFHSYGLRGTPSILLNGMPAPPAGGGINSAEMPYEQLCEIIDGMNNETTKVRLPVSATAEGSQVNLSVKVEGLEEIGKALRLHIALAEKEVWFHASNGIRRHDMIVRSMIGGAEGIAPKDGKLEYEGSEDIAELKQNLAAYLDEFETNRGRLPGKPLDLSHLEVVAWVQDTENGDILHATVMPVEGTLELTEAESAAETQDSETAPASDEAASEAQAPKVPQKD